MEDRRRLREFRLSDPRYRQNFKGRVASLSMAAKPALDSYKTAQKTHFNEYYQQSVCPLDFHQCIIILILFV